MYDGDFIFALLRQRRVESLVRLLSLLLCRLKETEMNASIDALLDKAWMIAEAMIFTMLKYKYAAGSKHPFVKNEVG